MKTKKILGRNPTRAKEGAETGKAGTRQAHKEVKLAEKYVELLQRLANAHQAIVNSLRVYNSHRLSSGGTDDWTIATMQPLICYMGWEGRSQEYSELLSREPATSSRKQKENG